MKHVVSRKLYYPCLAVHRQRGRIFSIESIRREDSNWEHLDWRQNLHAVIDVPVLFVMRLSEKFLDQYILAYTCVSISFTRGVSIIGRGKVTTIIGIFFVLYVGKNCKRRLGLREVKRSRHGGQVSAISLPQKHTPQVLWQAYDCKQADHHRSSASILQLEEISHHNFTCFSLNSVVD